MRELKDDYNLVIYDVIALTPDYGYVKLYQEAKLFMRLLKKAVY